MHAASFSEAEDSLKPSVDVLALAFVIDCDQSSQHQLLQCGIRAPVRNYATSYLVRHRLELGRRKAPMPQQEQKALLNREEGAEGAGVSHARFAAHGLHWLPVLKSVSRRCLLGCSDGRSAATLLPRPLILVSTRSPTTWPVSGVQWRNAKENPRTVVAGLGFGERCGWVALGTSLGVSGEQVKRPESRVWLPARPAASCGCARGPGLRPPRARLLRLRARQEAWKAM